MGLQPKTEVRPPTMPSANDQERPPSVVPSTETRPTATEAAAVHPTTVQGQTVTSPPLLPVELPDQTRARAEQVVAQRFEAQLYQLQQQVGQRAEEQERAYQNQYQQLAAHGAVYRDRAQGLHEDL